MNFAAPRRWRRSSRELKKQTGAGDPRRSLRAGGRRRGRRPKAALSVQKQPLAAALAKLLEPLALGYRVVDAQTIQVTSRKAAGGAAGTGVLPVGGRPARRGGFRADRADQEPRRRADLERRRRRRRDPFRSGFALPDRAAIAGRADRGRGLAGGKGPLSRPGMALILPRFRRGPRSFLRFYAPRPKFRLLFWRRRVKIIVLRKLFHRG